MVDGIMERPLNRRLRQLEKDERARAGYAPGGDRWYQFTVAPSCPPNRQLHIRGGNAIPSIRWRDFMEQDYIPDTVCDFENATETQMDLVFTNAGYFLPILLCYYGDYLLDGRDPIFDNVIGTEVATAAQAEAQIDGWLNGVEQWYYYRLPLSGVVLRNNGYTGVAFAIEPIDMVNRGRSYLYRDARSFGGVFS